MQHSWDPHLALPGPEPLGLEVERAEGLYIYTTDGRRYMDMISGLAINNIGHRHPRVLEAIKEQSEKYLHVMVYGEFHQRPQRDFARLLTSILPAQLNCAYFVNSGTEANEGALKLAKRHTGRRQLIAFKGAYHGSTKGSLSVAGNEEKKAAFQPLLPEVSFLEFNNFAALQDITEATAGVIVEPVQGDAGIRIPSKDWMLALRERCSETGALLIFDEVQTGFGRTGTLFAFEQFDVVPDILTIGKAMGGGLAMGGFIASKELMADFQSNPALGHITSFGGHPLCCAAGHASLQVILDEGLVKHVAAKGHLIRESLNHPTVKEIRQIGLFIAIEMADWETVEAVVKKCLEKGVIGFYFLSCRNSFRLAPPLNITTEQIKEACRLITEAMDEIAG